MRSTTLAGVVFMFLFAHAASAEIVHFVNPAPGQPGHYDWRWEPADGWRSWLDVTLAASDQTNAPSGNSVSQGARHEWGVNFNFNLSGDYTPSAGVLTLTGGWSYPTLNLEFGEPVRSTLGDTTWSGYTEHVVPATWWPLMSHFPEGQPGYMGVRTAGGHLGWIEVVRTGMSLGARSWAYQTQPDGSITAGQVPSPGAAALLALASFTGRRRRRS